MFITALHRRGAFGELPAGFPVIESSSTFADTSSTTSRDISMPSGVQAGDLLVLLVMSDESTTFGHTGWTLARREYVTEVTTAVIYRVATGSDSLTLTTNSQRVTGIVLRVSGQAASDYIATAGAVSATSTNPIDPAQLSLGASASRLWLVVAGWNSETVSLSSVSSGYTEIYNYNSASYTIANAWIGYREAEAAAETPGDITLSGTDKWVVITVGITP